MIDFDNTPSSAKWTIAEVITFVGSVSLILYSHFHESAYVACYTIGGLGLLAHIIMLLIDPSYIYFSDEGKNFVIRTCTSYPVFRKFREYPFPKSSLVSFKIDEKMFGYKKIMTIMVQGLDPQTKKPKTCEIDNINLSALSNEEIESIKSALSRALNK